MSRHRVPGAALVVVRTYRQVPRGTVVGLVGSGQLGDWHHILAHEGVQWPANSGHWYIPVWLKSGLAAEAIKFELVILSPSGDVIETDPRGKRVLPPPQYDVSYRISWGYREIAEVLPEKLLRQLDLDNIAWNGWFTDVFTRVENKNLPEEQSATLWNYLIGLFTNQKCDSDYEVDVSADEADEDETEEDDVSADDADYDTEDETEEDSASSFDKVTNGKQNVRSICDADIHDRESDDGSDEPSLSLGRNVIIISTDDIDTNSDSEVDVYSLYGLEDESDFEVTSSMQFNSIQICGGSDNDIIRASEVLPERTKAEEEVKFSTQDAYKRNDKILSDNEESNSTFECNDANPDIILRPASDLQSHGDFRDKNNDTDICATVEIVPTNSGEGLVKVNEIQITDDDTNLSQLNVGDVDVTDVIREDDDNDIQNNLNSATPDENQNNEDSPLETNERREENQDTTFHACNANYDTKDFSTSDDDTDTCATGIHSQGLPLDDTVNLYSTGGSDGDHNVEHPQIHNITDEDEDRDVDLMPMCLFDDEIHEYEPKFPHAIERGGDGEYVEDLIDWLDRTSTIPPGATPFSGLDCKRQKENNKADTRFKKAKRFVINKLRKMKTRIGNACKRMKRAVRHAAVELYYNHLYR